MRLIAQDWKTDNLSRLFDVTETMEREFPYIEIVPDDVETSEDTNMAGNVHTSNRYTLSVRSKYNFNKSNIELLFADSVMLFLHFHYDSYIFIPIVAILFLVLSFVLNFVILRI